MGLVYVLFAAFVGGFLGALCGAYYACTLDYRQAEVTIGNSETEAAPESGPRPFMRPKHGTYHSAKKPPPQEPLVNPEVMGDWMYGASEGEE